MSESDLSGRLPGPGDRPAPPPVVEQRVDRFLQHALLVVDDDLGGAEVEQALEPVVAVDDPAVEVVQVGGGEAATVELDHRPQLGRDHRHRVEDHGPRVVDAAPVVVTPVEGGHDLEPLDGLLAALGGQRPALGVGLDQRAELLLLDVEVDAVDEPLDGVGAHAAVEVVAVAVGQLPPQRLVVDDLAREELPEGVPAPGEQVDVAVVLLAHRLEALLGRLLAGPQLGVLGPLALELGDFLLELLVDLGQAALPLLGRAGHARPGTRPRGRAGRSGAARRRPQVTRLAAK